MMEIYDHVNNACGCCGRALDDEDADWCKDCQRHVLPQSSGPPWDQTYLAQFGRECPFANGPFDGGHKVAA